MRIDVDFISRWASTLNSLSKATAQRSPKLDADRIVDDLKNIGAQLPFDPSCTPMSRLYWYRRFAVAIENNEFIAVFRFVQEEGGDFVMLQQALGLHMGLFAYVDVTSNSIRYLYGPGDYRDDRGSDDKEKPQPHFLIKAFYESRRPLGGDVWLEEPTWHFARMSEAFYYSRKREAAATHVWQVGFVRILDGGSPEQLNEWESKLGVLYAPSGEIDACILCWLLLHLDEETRGRARAWCEKVAAGDFTGEGAEQFEFRLTESAIPRARSYDDGHPVIESHYWGQGRARSIVGWLESLGLILDSGTFTRSCTTTPKGRALVEWMAFYLKEAAGTPLDKSLIADWLQSDNCNKERQRFLTAAERAYPDVLAEGVVSTHRAGVGDELDYRALIAALCLLLAWSPAEESAGQGASPLEAGRRAEGSAVRFAAACRLNLHAHLILRAGTRHRGITENLPRAWLAFPVLHVSPEKIFDIEELSEFLTLRALQQDAASLLPVGFFLGTIRDLDEDGRTSPSLRSTGRETLARRIAALRALIHPLAEIENRETFFLDINARRHAIDAERRAAELVTKLSTISLSSEEDTGAVQAVEKAIAEVLLADSSSGSSGLEGVSRFTLMRLLYQTLNDLLHLRERDAIPQTREIDSWLSRVKKTSSLLRTRDAAVRDPKYFATSRDVEILTQLAHELQEIRSTGSVTIHRIVRVAQDIKNQLRSYDAFTVKDALKSILSLNAPQPVGHVVQLDRHFGAYCCLRPDKWGSVLDSHIPDHSDQWHCVTESLFWITLAGHLPADARVNYPSGGYESLVSNQPLTIDGIVRRSTGKKWIESMVPHYFSPCLLETKNSTSWYCWDLSRYVAGAPSQVFENEFNHIVPGCIKPLEEGGVRILIKADHNLLGV